MTAQINDQKTYQASQMAHHMRRLSESTAAAYHNLNVDTSSLPFLSSTSSNASSSSSSKSKGENSPSSNYSDRSENPLRTPSSSTFSAGLPYNATASVMSNAYNQTYPVATADRHAPNPLHANPLLYDSAPSKTDLFTCNSAILPTATSYHDLNLFMPALGMCQPSQGRTTVQLPQQTFAGMDSAPAAASFYTAASTSSSSPARNLHGLSAPFSSYSFDPSYPSRAYQMHAPEVDFRSYSINPQALSLDIFQAPSEPQPPPTSATVFDEPLSFSPTPERSPSFDVSPPHPPRASSVSPNPRITEPQRPPLRRHSDSYTSDHRPLRNPVGPAKKGRKRKSGWSVDANMEWEGVIDKKERRKMQNRMAQRAFRARMKAHKD